MMGLIKPRLTRCDALIAAGRGPIIFDWPLPPLPDTGLRLGSCRFGRKQTVSDLALDAGDGGHQAAPGYLFAAAQDHRGVDVAAQCVATIDGDHVKLIDAERTSICEHQHTSSFMTVC